MRVIVDDIPERGLAVTAGLSEVWAVRAATVALDAPPTELSANLRIAAAQPGIVTVTGTAHAAAPRECDRCTEAMTCVIDAEVDLRYAPVAVPSADDDEVELKPDDLDLGEYTGGALALEAVLSEALALALPSRVVCADTAGCDARTAALLEAHARRGPAAGATETALGGAFAALRQREH